MRERSTSMTFRLLNGHKTIQLMAFSCPPGASTCRLVFRPLKPATLCVSAFHFSFGCAVQLFCWHSTDFRGRTTTRLIESTVAALLRRDDRCDKSQHTRPSARGEGGGAGTGAGLEENNTSVAGHGVVEADGPYGLLPLSTGCSSAPLIWQEWHLRRGSKPRFNEQRTLLNSLCADRLLLLLLCLLSFTVHQCAAAVPLHNKARAQLSSTAASSAFTATFRRRNANVGISPRRARANATTAERISIHKWRRANAYFTSCTHVMSTLTALLSRQSSHHCH